MQADVGNNHLIPLEKRNLRHFVFFDFQDWQGEQEEYLDLQHLNTKGANKFTPYFDSVITAQLQLPLN